MYMFRDVMKDIHSYFECNSQIVAKLRKLYWLYSSLMNIDKRLEELNLGISDFEEMKQV